MKSIWKEYGLISLLIVVAVGGYLLVDRNKEDILSYSLDAIGSRLVALVDDDVSKRRIALAFDSFKRRVANDEVSPEQVELVAANILNLSTSGARITPEDAELILNLNEEAMLADLPMPASPAGEEPTADSAPRPDPPTEPASPSDARAAAPARPPVAVTFDARALASRIEAMVGVAESMERTARADTMVGRYMLFSPTNGLHVVIDPESGRQEVRVDIESIRAAAESSARADRAARGSAMVRVDETMAEQQTAWATFVERQHRDMELFQRDLEIQSAEFEMAMERLERLAKLQDMGMFAPFDTVKFGQKMDELKKRLRVKVVRTPTTDTPPTDSDSR